MTYEIAMGYMKEIQKRGSILGLNPVRSLLNRLQNPQNALSVIHVAGTNERVVFARVWNRCIFQSKRESEDIFHLRYIAIWRDFR